jgi:hypothetical protein
MARRGKETATVTESELPPFRVFSDGDFGYLTRYRIISEDGARFSHWSPIFKVIPDYIFQRPFGKLASDLIIIAQGIYVNVIWDPVSVINRITNNTIKKAQQYDVFVRWDRGETNGVFIPTERVEGAAQGLIVPEEYGLLDGTVVDQRPNRISVEVYVRADPADRNNTRLRVYKRDNLDISQPVGPPAI